MPKLPRVKTKEIIDFLGKLGFIQAKAKGTAHRVFKHIDGRRTTVSIHGNNDIYTGTLLAILRDIKISKEEFTLFFKKKTNKDRLAEEEAIQMVLRAEKEISEGKGLTGDLRELAKKYKNKG